MHVSKNYLLPLLVWASLFVVGEYKYLRKYLLSLDDFVPTSGLQKIDIDISPPSITTRPLNPVNKTLHHIYTNGCCGIGHRISRVVPTFVWANRMNRKANVVWDDIRWGALFNDTEQVMEGHRDDGWDVAEREKLLVGNSMPKNWTNNYKKYVRTGTVFDEYNPEWFEDELIVPMLVSLRHALSPLVLSFLNSIRAQLNEAKNDEKHVTICTHVRQGNNETGDWQSKEWRHFVDIDAVLNSTRALMEDFVHSKNATIASVYVASDNPGVRTWFSDHLPKHWKMVQPEKVMPKPENGVWFGQHGSHTSDVLNQTMKNEAMAEATSDVFALGECDALIIPNYSSFTFSAIALTRARKSPVFFRNEEGIEFREMSTFESFKDGNGGGDNDDDDNGQGSVPREESLATKIEKLRYRRRLMLEEREGRFFCDEEL